MDFDKNLIDIINFLRSNHLVQECLEHKPIHAEFKNNPRFQSIIWHISVMLNRAGLDFSDKKATEWIDTNITIGEQGEIIYILSPEDRYYLAHSPEGLQFVKYFFDQNGLKRSVVEVGKNNKRNLQILSSYNEDGIEESQIVEDFEANYISNLTRVKNHPELRRIIDYSKNEEKIKSVEYEQRTFWVALEDLNPNLIEVDPLETNPLLKYGNSHFYDTLSIKNENQIPALPEMRREELFQDYKNLNRNYHRTTDFEKGIAKLFCVRNRDFFK